MKNITTSEGATTSNYHYDANGNIQIVSEEGTTSYTYTPLNEVATLVTPDGTKTSYGYDTKGIRTKKEVEGTKHVYYYAYDAFGNRIEVIETLYNPMTYRGYYYDEEAGDYYLRARYYNASIGRFISEDSYRGKYEDPLSLNLYTYGHNSPLYYSDPRGQWYHPSNDEIDEFRDIFGK